MMNSRFLTAISCSLLLTACGLGSSNLELPPERPHTQLSGQVLQMRNADIQVFTYDANGKGDRLGGVQSDENGQFQLDLQIPSQPVLLQITGGQYLEEASDQTIALHDDLQLNLITQVIMGENQSQLEISLLSHLMSGLVDYHRQQGDAIDSALEQANQQINEALQLNLLHPQQTLSGDKPSLGNLHYAYNAVLSFFTRWASEQNGNPPHQGYHSLSLAKLIYNDVRHDGMLDGHSATSSEMALGIIPLNADSYRMGLAQQLLASAAYLQQHYNLGEAELSTLAQQIVQNQSALFANRVFQPVSSMLPNIKALTQSSKQGVIPVQLSLESPVGIKQIEYILDGTTLTQTATASTAITFDSRSYADGIYFLEIIATDVLDNQQRKQFSFEIDNVYLTLESPLLANSINYPLQGRYFGANATQISANNVPMNINPVNQTWSGAITLGLGDNAIELSMLAEDGQIDKKTVTINLHMPVIATDSHGNSRFTGDYTTYLPMQDSNSTPLLLDNVQLSLAGTPINRDALNTARIPFFAFHAYNTDRSGTPLDEAVEVRFEYFINDIFQTSATLQPINGEYLIPLSTETLVDHWHQTSPSDQHHIVATVTNQVGLSVQKSVDFRLDVLPPPIKRVKTNYTYLTDVSFSTRSSMSGRLYTVVRHELQNAGSKDFMIYLQDEGSYPLRQKYDEKKSLHLIEKVITPVWEFTFPQYAADNALCPTLEGQPTTEHDYIFDFTGAATNNGFTRVNKPESWIDSTQYINTVTLPASESTVAEPLHLTPPHATGNTGTGAYAYDYLLSPESNTPAYISGRTVNLYNPQTQTSSPFSCPEVHGFKQFERTSYQSAAGYPQNQITVLEKTYIGTLKGFKVRNLDTGSDISPENGWYRIPAGARIEVTKLITLPVFDLHTDSGVVNLTFDAFTEKYLDRSLEWSLSDQVIVFAAHNINDTLRMNELTQSQQKVAVTNLILSLSRQQ